MQGAIDAARAREIPSQWFFDDDARTLGTTRRAKLRCHIREQARRDGKVMAGPLRGAEGGAQLRNVAGVAIVAVDVTQLVGEARDGSRIDATAIVCEACVHSLYHGLARNAAASHADHERWQPAAPLEILERGKYLLVGEVAGDTEYHQRIGKLVLAGMVGHVHVSCSLSLTDSRRYEN